MLFLKCLFKFKSLDFKKVFVKYRTYGIKQYNFKVFPFVFFKIFGKIPESLELEV